MKVALLLVGHLRENPRVALLRNLEMVQSTFGIERDSVSVYISTYDVRGTVSHKKNYDDVSTGWIDNSSDSSVFDDLRWMKKHPRVALIDEERYAATQLEVYNRVELLLTSCGGKFEGAGLVASGVAQARKIVRLWEAAGLADSDFDLVVKSRPDASAKFDSRGSFRAIPKPMEIMTVGKLRYVTEHPNHIRGPAFLNFLAKRRAFMNDIVYWAKKSTFMKWVSLLGNLELQLEQMTPDLAAVPLRSTAGKSRKQTDESWAMPELRFAALARSQGIKVSTIEGSIERHRG